MPEILFVILGVLVFDVIVRGIAARMILRVFERKPQFGQPPHSEIPAEETVRFPTSDGLMLRGRIYRQLQRESSGVVIFCPEMEGDSTSALAYCEALWQAGYDIFAFDFRNQGESDSLPGYNPLHWVTEYEVQDVLAAIQYVRDVPAWQVCPLGMVGMSRGGGAALAAAARSHEVDCLVVEGTFSTERLMEFYTLRWAALYIPQWLMNLFPLWHVRGTLAIVRWLSEWRRKCRYINLEKELATMPHKPLLLIHGEKDSYVPQPTVQPLVRKLSTKQEFWMVANASHNQSRDVARVEYDRRLLDFFERHLQDAENSCSPSQRQSASVSRAFQA